MTVNVDTQNLVAKMESVSDEVFEQAMRRWYSASQKHLEEAINDRAGPGSEGMVSRQDEGGMDSILRSAMPPRWNGDKIEFVYTHFAAVYHEFGTRPHEIEADPGEVLAFPWPDAPQDIQEQFEDTFPVVFFKEVLHPGTPAIGFVRYGRQQAEQFLRGEGVETVDIEPREARLNSGARKWIQERGLA